MSSIPIKHDRGKPALELIPPELLFSAGRAFEYGRHKYGKRNWELNEGLDPDRLYGALLRHLAARDLGELVDPESGLDHFDHAAASLAMLIATTSRRTSCPTTEPTKTASDVVYASSVNT